MGDADDDIPDFFNEAADPDVVRQLSGAVDLPAEYIAFLLNHNGGEVQFNELSVILWPAEDLEGFNRAYHVEEFAPGIFLVGTSGGGEAYGFDLSDAARPFVRIPFIPLDRREMLVVARNFSEILKKRLK